MSRKFAFKLLFYCLFVLYVLGDLHLWHGYLAGKMEQHLRQAATTPGDSSDILFYVFGRPVTRNQIDRAKEEVAYLRGSAKSPDGTWTKEQDASLEAAARLRVMRGELLRVKSRYSDMSLPDRSAEARVEMTRLASRAGTGEQSLASRLERQKTNFDLFRKKTEARLKETDYLEDRIKQAIPVPEADLKNYYDQIKDDLAIPRHRQLSHIFLATLDKDPEQVKSTAEGILKQLNQQNEFSQLAARYSEDESSARQGGNLGIVTEKRNNILKNVDLFELPVGRPVLRQSGLGWHIFLAGPIEEGRILSFEEAEPSLQTALESMRRDRAVSIYADQSIRNARREQRIWENNNQ